MISDEFTQITYDDCKHVLKLLESRLPRASMLYNVIKLYQAVSSTQNAAITFKFGAYNGDVISKDAFFMAVINVVGLPQNLILFSPPLFPTQVMLQAVSKSINWSQQIQFEGIENSMVSSIVQYGKQHGKIERRDPIELYYLPTPENLELPHHSNDEIVKQLSIDDALKINSKWAAASEGSLDLLRASINCVGSAGVFVKNEDYELVSWAVALPFGSIHALHTESNHQRKGYARLTMTAVSQFIAKQNRLPIVQIYKSNDTSKSVNEKVGYIYSHDVNLLHYHPL